MNNWSQLKEFRSQNNRFQGDYITTEENKNPEITFTKTNVFIHQQTVK